ncbi:uncharacterized protein BDW43DRAFT_317339 [Aspergillus alliaceus]|uniref:uncharacterized protein n=1 Tax=Petromyces alliaceus TaxID=209559 RepID=UPI0012A55682|nr:uncharacterized protein BDW43DRAFT_317339 [Aspergillus alliaceus]KAB8226911.1 hypothetical protein BDW43DRAFT_317339 [Aspergillus alliaceus]
MGWESRWNEVYEEICEALARETDTRGRKLSVNGMDELDPRYLVGSSRVEDEDAPAASYVNFYFVNRALIVLAFGDPTADQAAVEMYRHLAPERTVRTVLVNSLPRMGGVLHCVTQQIPLQI